MDPAVAALQNVINRFAAVGGFARVDVDGAWGSKTKQGVYSALSWIGQGKCYQTACATPEMSQTAGRIVVEWNESMNTARGLTEFLGEIANDLGLPLVASPVPQPSGGSVVVLPPTALQVGLVDRFKALPFWQQVALGILAGLGLIFVANRIKRA